MASIVLRQFGGMMPSANKKAIPEAAAIYVRNLDLRFGDFRPLPVPTTVTTATAGTALYKFDGAETFITKATGVSFARGPIPNDTSERTYYTGDGWPKVTDLGGEVRRLGVPAPTAAPTVVTAPNGEFSQADSDEFLPKVRAVFQNTLWANRQWAYVGLGDSELPEFAATDLPWAFDFVIPGTVVDGAFVPTNASHRNLMDSRLGYRQGVVEGNTYGFVQLNMRAAYMLFTANLEPALEGILNPEDGVSPMLDSDQVDDIIQTLEDGLRPADTARDATINRMRALKSEFVTLANSSEVIAMADAGALSAFYQRTEIAAALTAARVAAANEILNAIATFNTSEGGG